MSGSGPQESSGLLIGTMLVAYMIFASFLMILVTAVALAPFLLLYVLLGGSF